MLVSVGADNFVSVRLTFITAAQSECAMLSIEMSALLCKATP